MRAIYTGLPFSAPLPEGKGPASSQQMLVQATVPAQAPLIPICGNGFLACNFLRRAGGGGRGKDGRWVDN